MREVLKLSKSECYTPSLEHSRIQLLFVTCLVIRRYGTVHYGHEHVAAICCKAGHEELTNYMELNTTREATR
jgi:hypothetical protein